MQIKFTVFNVNLSFVCRISHVRHQYCWKCGNMADHMPFLDIGMHEWFFVYCLTPAVTLVLCCFIYKQNSYGQFYFFPMLRDTEDALLSAIFMTADFIIVHIVTLFHTNSPTTRVKISSQYTRKRRQIKWDKINRVPLSESIIETINQKIIQKNEQ